MSNTIINFEFKSKEDFVKKYAEYQKEIERQKEIIRQLDIKNLELTTIIKEVREYINSFESIKLATGIYKYQNAEFIAKFMVNILEILDKVGDEV